MKIKIITIAFFVFIITNAFSQSNWDASHYGINLFQTGNVKYALGDSSFNKIGNTTHPMASFYGILPDDGWWIYGDASGFLLVALALSNKSIRDYHASLYEFGAGWSFNNKRPIRIGNIAEIKIVMGLALGSRGFRTIKTGASAVGVGIYPIELGSMINIKDRVTVLAKFGLHPFYGGIGGRVFYDIRSTLKLGNRFGLSCTFVKNRYYYKEGHQVTNNNLNVPESFKFFNTQLGITFITSN